MGNIAGLIVCPICKEASGVAVTKRLDKEVPMQLEDIEPCEECKKTLVALFDVDTKEFVNYVSKEHIMTEEGIEITKKFMVKALVRIEGDKYIIVPTDEEGNIIEGQIEEY